MTDNQREAGTIILDPTHVSFSQQEGVNDLGATHFIGIGGAGMSVLAEMLHEQGVEVDGSDREPSAKTDRLQGLGIAVEFGQREENVEGKQTIVFSSAIKPDNPEIVAAHAAGERIVHRSDILSLLMNTKRAVTVAGAHGKTTTSSMLAHILTHAGEGNLAVLRALDASAAAHTVVYATQDAASLGDLNGAAFVHIESESESAQSGAEHFTLHVPAGLLGEQERMVPVTLAVPGIHNARNASAAIIAAALLGVDIEKAAEAATSFLGAARRFQVRGTVSQVTVVDDYAHHPTEISALLDAARRKYPQSAIRVIFQPHLFSRTKFFAEAFAEALAKADDVIVTGIFPAREKQEDYPTVGPATIVDEALKLDHTPAEDWIRGVEDMHTAAQMMVMRAHHGDVIFTVGAGDITQMDEVILHALQAHRWDCEG
ncbi:MAG: Mur ligase domain-containing protein [Bifidobacterium sp.]|nr:Mur ligase domain-containing protein [Bifidobacterium sp.]